jgi:hypothetical protein
VVRSARYWWQQAPRIAVGTPAFDYITVTRGIPLTPEQIPPTVRWLPAKTLGCPYPNIVSAFGLPAEDEPGKLNRTGNSTQSQSLVLGGLSAASPALSLLSTPIIGPAAGTWSFPIPERADLFGWALSIPQSDTALVSWR